MGTLMELLMVAGIATTTGAWMVYEHFAEGLPDVDDLLGYQPPVMSRVYANDGKFLAEQAAHTIWSTAM